MKKNSYIIISLIINLLAITACNDDKYNGIDNSGEVKIVSFSDNHAKLITLNEVNGNIKLIYPSNINLGTLSPSDRKSVV